MSDQRKETTSGLSRRGLLGTTATAAGLAGLAAGGSGAALLIPAHAATGAAASSTEVKPGDLDEYYAFNSSGQTGEVRIQVLPSDAS